MPNYKSLRAAVRAAIQACLDGTSDRCLGRVDSAAVIPARGGYDVAYNGYVSEDDRRPVYRTRAIDWTDVGPEDLDDEIKRATENAESADE